MGVKLFLAIRKPSKTKGAARVRLLESCLSSGNCSVVMYERPNKAPVDRTMEGIVLGGRFARVKRVARLLLCTTTETRLVRRIVHPTLRSKGVMVYSQFIRSSTICRKVTEKVKVSLICGMGRFTVKSAVPSLAVVVSLSTRTNVSEGGGRTRLSQVRDRAVSFRGGIIRKCERLTDLRPSEVCAISKDLAVRRVRRGVISRIGGGFRNGK